MFPYKVESVSGSPLFKSPCFIPAGVEITCIIRDGKLIPVVIEENGKVIWRDRWYFVKSRLRRLLRSVLGCFVAIRRCIQEVLRS